ncbi:hypothetical protein IC582_025964 [Cucumis melo]
MMDRYDIMDWPRAETFCVSGGKTQTFYLLILSCSFRLRFDLGFRPTYYIFNFFHYYTLVAIYIVLWIVFSISYVEC